MLRTITGSESYIILSVVTLLALVALIYLLSPMSLLDDITTRGAEIRTRLRELVGHRRQYPGNIKNKVLAAYVDLSLEHHEAIWLLTVSGLHGLRWRWCGRYTMPMCALSGSIRSRPSSRSSKPVETTCGSRKRLS
jgi:hypothetical protein